MDILDTRRQSISGSAITRTNVLKGVAAAVVLIALAAGGVHAWKLSGDQGPGPGFVSGNGRIEAVEVDIASKLPGRLADVLVAEGDTVQAGQVLAHMDASALRAQRSEALAREQQARDAVAGAEAQVAMRRSDLAAAAALRVQRESELDAARRRLARSTVLAQAGAATLQELDDDRA
ncbi:HlyD family secretion protein, partial [Telluria sp. Tellsp104]